MCDCAEEAERRRQKAAQDKANAADGGSGAGGLSGSGRGGRDPNSGSVAPYVFGGTALLFGFLAILHKYLGVLDPVLQVMSPFLESWGIHIGQKSSDDPSGSLKARCRKPVKKREPYKDPNDCNPDRCDGLRLDPCKRKWPLENK